MTEPRASRQRAGHTQTEAAELLGVAFRSWQDWESSKIHTPIPPPMLRLYRHLAGIERIPFRHIKKPPTG